MSARSFWAALAVVAATSAACTAGSAESSAPTAPTVTTTTSQVEGLGGLELVPKRPPAPIRVPVRLPDDITVKGVEAEVISVPETEQCTLAVTMPAEVGFGFDSAALTPDGEAAVRAAATLFEGATALSIVGHSSSEGDPAYNVDLSRRRAASVANVLAPFFPDATLTVTGVGAAQPVADESTEEGRARNRRVVIEADIAHQECA